MTEDHAEKDDKLPPRHGGYKPRPSTSGVRADESHPQPPSGPGGGSRSAHHAEQDALTCPVCTRVGGVVGDPRSRWRKCRMCEASWDSIYTEAQPIRPGRVEP